MAFGIFKNFAQNNSDLFTGVAGYAYPADMNADGYPKNSASPLAGNIARKIKFPSFITASTVMVLRWTGTATNATGAIQLLRSAPGFAVVSGASFVVGSTAFNLNVSGTDGRITFTFNGPVLDLVQGLNLVFQPGSTFTNIANLILCRLSDEAAVLSATTPEDMFIDEYVAIYDALNPKVIRPMGWTNPNEGANVSQLRYVPNWQTSLDRTTVSWAPGAWAGTTGSSTNAYTCGPQPDATGVYVRGEMIQLQFTNASSAPGSLTLNSNGRGPKPIYNKFPTPQNAIAAGQLATLIYDDVLDVWLMNDIPAQTAIMPYELQIGFANRINAHFWMNIPFLFNDASVTALTALVRTRLNSNLNAYFEYANEVWNNSPGYYHTNVARQRGIKLGFDAADADERATFGWYALRCREMFGLIESAWSPRTTTQMKRVLAFKAFGSPTGTDLYRIKGSDLASVALGGTGDADYIAYTGGGAGANYRTAPNRPIDKCEVLAYATYFSGAQLTNFDENYKSLGAANVAGLITAADNYAAGGAGITSAFNFLNADIRDGHWASSGTAGGETLKSLNDNIYPPWNTICAQYTNRTIECYEGGFEAYYFRELQTSIVLGVSVSHTVTFNVGSHPAVNWTAHGFPNGASIGFTAPGNTVPSDIWWYDYAGAGDRGHYYIANATANAFDVSTAPVGGTIINFTGAGTGTQTCIASKYDNETGRVAKMLMAFKHDPIFGQIVTDQYAQFMAQSKSATWTWLLLPGPNQWATFEGDEYTPSLASWDAMVAINHS